MSDFTPGVERNIRIPSGQVFLEGILTIPKEACGLVLFVHGSGSSRLSVRNQYVAKSLNQVKLATLLFDLLTPDEEHIDEYTREFRFDIALLAKRLLDTTRWCIKQQEIGRLPIGYFGASTGGGAALVAAAQASKIVQAVVSRGGRPDLAGTALIDVETPTLLIVGGNDDMVIELNQEAFKKIHCIKELKIVPGATHLFEEPGTLDEVARLAAAWFVKYLAKS